MPIANRCYSLNYTIHNYTTVANTKIARDTNRGIKTKPNRTETVCDIHRNSLIHFELRTSIGRREMQWGQQHEWKVRKKTSYEFHI